MIVIDTTIRPVSTSTAEGLMFEFHRFPSPTEPVIDITPRGKTVFSEEEALSILFPDAKSRMALQKALSRQHADIRESIRLKELNPIRGWRMIREMDQTELARATGIRQPNIARMERLGANQSIPTLRKIAKALKVNVEELLP